MASAMLLLKAPLLVPAAVAAGLALAWGQEWRCIGTTSGGMLLGLAPGIGWHLWHAHIRGSWALWLWGGDGAGRVLLDAGEGSDLGWRVPVIEVLEGGWPWLPLLPFALVWAWRWRQSRWGWGRWSLACLLTLAGAILPLRTQLPWYSHPLWLPIALLCAPLLAWLVERPSSSSNEDATQWSAGAGCCCGFQCSWCGLGLLLLLLWLSSFSSIGSSLVPYRGLAGLGLGWCGGGWWLRSGAPQRRRLGVISLSCGNVAALALLFHSPCGCGSSTKPGPCNRWQPWPVPTLETRSS